MTKSRKRLRPKSWMDPVWRVGGVFMCGRMERLSIMIVDWDFVGRVRVRFLLCCRTERPLELVSDDEVERVRNGVVLESMGLSACRASARVFMCGRMERALDHDRGLGTLSVAHARGFLCAAG